MKKLMILLAGCASCLVLNSYAGKLGEGITAYYPFNQNSVDGSISGQKWSAGALENDANLSFNTSAGNLGGNGNNPIFGSDNFVLSGAGTSLKVNGVEANAAYPATSGNWSVSLWAKRESSSTLPCLYYHGPNYADAAMSVPGEGENGGFGIYVTSGGRVVVGFSTSTDGLSFTYHSITSTTWYSWTDSLPNWHHIAVVRYGATVTLWVDGTSQGSATIDVAANLSLSSGSRLSLSKSSAAMYLQNGTDDLCFWSRALADNEITVLSKRKGDGLATPLSVLADVEVVDATMTVAEDKLWSAILSDAGITSENSEYASLVITAQGKPKITFDVADSKLLAMSVSGAAVFAMDSSLYENGSFEKSLLETTVAISAPDIDFEVNSGWKGSFVRSVNAVKLCAQNTETISINIGGGDGTADTSDAENLVSGNDYYGLYPTPGFAWNNISGQWLGAQRTVTLTSAKAFDGETTTTRNTIQLSGTANNTWQWTGTAVPFLRGYLDDTGSVSVQIVGVPYSVYDVIIYATSDNSQNQLNYFTINGANYTCGSDGIATEGTSAWGAGQTKTAQLGKNAMLVQGVTGSTLTISGTRAAPSSGPRVTVCAVQIVNKGVVESSDWSANLDATTTFSGGTGAGLSDQSGTWANSSLASIIITNKATDATLTLDGEITAGVLKVVGEEGKCLSIAKGSGAALDIAVYDLTESAEETAFLFDPDFSKVNAGANLIGVGYDYTGIIDSGLHYLGSANTLTMKTVDGGSVVIAGGGTITNNLDVLGNATVTLSGSYTTSGFSRLGATKGTIVVDSGSDVTFSSVMLANSGSGENYNRLDVNGTLRVSSVSTTSSVYDRRNDYEGILFGHWKGTSTVNVGAGGSILAENAWMQLSYTTNSVVTINGGTVKVLGINGGVWTTSYVPELTLTGGGCLEFAESPINMNGVVRNYGYGTIKTYSHGGSTGWTDPGAITFTDTTNGTTIDPCGMSNAFSGALSGAGKIIVNDSVGGGSVSFTGNASNFTGDIAVGANSTLNLGVTRPAGTLTVNGTLTVQMQTGSDVIELSTSAQPANIILYDANGNVVSNPRVTYSDGTLTIMPPVPVLEASGTIAFDTAANWVDSVMPGNNGDAIIKLSDDATITVSGTYTLGSLTITGSGVVTFSGNGTITAANISVKNGATFTRNANISATTGISLGSGTVLRLDGVTENAAISGAGAVETYGSVKFAADNTFTGGLTVNLGSIARTTVQQGFGKNNYGQAIANLSRIMVLDGGSLDLANTKDTCYAITIAGKGVIYDGVYLGALFNSGPEIGQGSRQTASLTLSADAMVRAEASTNGWGIVNSGHAASVLALNGHTLTVSGAGYFPIDNANTASGTQTTGTLIADGVTLGLVSTASNLTGIDVIAKGCATINLATAPSALGSLTIEPAAGGTTASNWNLPANCVPVVNTSNVDPSGLSNGQSVVLFTDTHESLKYGSNIVWQVGGRFEGHHDAHEVTATFAAGIPQPLLHYDFNNDAAVDTGKASDSRYQITSFDGEAGSETLVNGRKGKAVQVHTGYTPYWGSTSFGNSPVHAGEVTVTTVARLNQTGIILWGLGNNGGSNTALGLVAPTATSAAVIMRNPDGTVTTLATVTDIGDLTKSWHFFAIVADANGTTFYVDDSKAASVVPAATAIGQQGQLGSFYNGAIGGSKAGDAGYYLDDWRVYDTALTAREIKALLREFFPPLSIRLR